MFITVDKNHRSRWKDKAYLKNNTGYRNDSQSCQPHPKGSFEFKAGRFLWSKEDGEVLAVGGGGGREERDWDFLDQSIHPLGEFISLENFNMQTPIIIFLSIINGNNYSEL
jgi:hypothetical protein